MKYLKLKENREFRRAYNRGEALVSPYFVAYVFKTKANRQRLGITVSKKLGCAVKRNRAKRVISAAFREVVPQISCGCDFVIVARSKILSVKSNEVAKILRKQFKKAGIVYEETTGENTN